MNRYTQADQVGIPVELGSVFAIEHKPERHEFNEQPAKFIRFMSQTGG